MVAVLYATALACVENYSQSQIKLIKAESLDTAT